MAEELHAEIRRAKQAWLNALQAVGGDLTKQPHSESPISVDISAFAVKSSQELLSGKHGAGVKQGP